MHDTDSLLDELAWRGMLVQTTEGLADALAAGPLRGYCGFDPTASSLHVGSLVPIMGLVHLQRAGHRPVALVGGGTGMIGDPSGKTAERQLHSADVVAENTRGIRAQLERFLDFGDASPNAAIMLDNAEWLAPMNLIEFLRDVGKHFSVNVMLAKDSVKGRMETGISYTEFSYMLLQSYDFLALFRRHGVTLQLGGNDQWGNMTAGTELIRRADGGSAHAFTLPLLTTASGAKFGKSEAGAVWLDAARTSPYQFYQFWMRTDDRDVGRLLRFFTLLPRAEIEALDAATAERPEKREAQHALATDVTTRVHGADAAAVAHEVSTLLFAKGDPRALSANALAALAREIPFVESAATDAIELFVAAELVPSKGAARRLLDQGGLTVSGRRLTAGESAVREEDELPGGHLLLRKGARDYALVRRG